jgi:hypothetical protein
VISSTHRKTVNIAYLIGIGIVVTMPDMVFGLLLEFIHVLFEFIEITLDKLVEHIFHTGLHETQIIVFYLLVSIALGALYYLWRVLLSLGRRCMARFLALYSSYKACALGYWRQLSLINKIKVVLIFDGIIYAASFLLM